jgi:putative tryptophan/tyrosine transport system substrate-binding protein
MKRKITVLALCSMLFAVCHSVEAQQTTKVPRIGFLGATSAASMSARTEAFRQGLRALGYVDGKNIVIEYRFADGKFDQVSPNASELVRLKVDVIVTAGPTDTQAARGATTTIPSSWRRIVILLVMGSLPA